MVSSVGAHDPASGPEQMRPYLEAKAEADRRLAASGLDWTIVRPGRLTDDPGTGSVLVSESHDTYGEIPRDDVAARARGRPRRAGDDRQDVRARVRRDAGRRGARGAALSRPAQTSISASALRMIRFSPCAASVSITAAPPSTPTDRPGHDDLLLGEAHPAELHRQALHLPRVAARRRCTARATCAIP